MSEEELLKHFRDNLKEGDMVMVGHPKGRLRNKPVRITNINTTSKGEKVYYLIGDNSYELWSYMNPDLIYPTKEKEQEILSTMLKRKLTSKGKELGDLYNNL
jgi:hypothetical protein